MPLGPCTTPRVRVVQHRDTYLWDGSSRSNDHGLLFHLVVPGGASRAWLRLNLCIMYILRWAIDLLSGDSTCYPTGMKLLGNRREVAGKHYCTEVNEAAHAAGKEHIMHCYAGTRGYAILTPLFDRSPMQTVQYRWQTMYMGLCMATDSMQRLFDRSYKVGTKKQLICYKCRIFNKNAS